MTALAPSGQTTRHRYPHRTRTSGRVAKVSTSRRHSRAWEEGPGGRTGPVSPQLTGLTRLSETTGSSLGPPARRKPPRGCRGVYGTGPRDRLPPEPPDPSLWAGPGKAGLKRGRSQAELGPRRLPRTLPAGAGGAGPEMALGAAPPRPGRCPGGGPADCPRVSRECTGRADPSKRP